MAYIFSIYLPGFPNGFWKQLQMTSARGFGTLLIVPSLASVLGYSVRFDIYECENNYRKSILCGFLRGA
jgi:hypothetical protein